MNKNGSIVIVDDSTGAQELMQTAFNTLNVSNELRFFSEGLEALNYLENSSEVPFLIISDINMPKVDGFTLKHQIDQNLPLRLMSIPFIFFSTAGSKKEVEKAYLMCAQGFFVKPASFTELGKVIHNIMEYWGNSLAPHDF